MSCRKEAAEAAAAAAIHGGAVTAAEACIGEELTAGKPGSRPCQPIVECESASTAASPGSVAEGPVDSPASAPGIIPELSGAASGDDEAGMAAAATTGLNGEDGLPKQGFGNGGGTPGSAEAQEGVAAAEGLESADRGRVASDEESDPSAAPMTEKVRLSLSPNVLG